MEFEFDAGKSERNRSERGFGFGFAARIFLSRTLVSFARAESGEIRIKAVGRIDDTCYVVIFADEGEIRRIISTRRANQKERQQWLASE